ncbi:hypothetical protein EG350_16810 [Chryseobacterium shandongense]|nr:hypothetical protein EG350_16810 [Chryseobacterium shandongense]
MINLMKKTLLFFLIIFKTSVFCQVGFVSNINTKLKHIHAEVGDNIEVQFTEVLDYDASDFIKQLTIQTKKPNDFDFKILNNNSFLSDKKQREYIREYCNKNNIEKLIILYRNPFFAQNSPYRNLHNLKFDFGILTQERKRKTIYYMNRMILAYYNVKEDKLLSTFLSGENSFHKEYFKRELNMNVVDAESKKLNNSSEVENDFIKKFENRLKMNFEEAVKK